METAGERLLLSGRVRETGDVAPPLSIFTSEPSVSQSEGKDSLSCMSWVASLGAALSLGYFTSESMPNKESPNTLPCVLCTDEEQVRTPCHQV